jgi:hypothetical protein
MRYFFLLLGAVLISSCSQSTGSMPSAGTAGEAGTRQTGPGITSVSKIEAKQTQKIVISGSGFGTMQPYNGDSGYLQILDTTGKWSAGYISSSQDDTVTLNVASWTDSKIVIKGFTGGYGESYWVLIKGDHLKINVWNAQTHAGPATAGKRVK